MHSMFLILPLHPDAEFAYFLLETLSAFIDPNATLAKFHPDAQFANSILLLSLHNAS